MLIDITDRKCNEESLAQARAVAGSARRNTSEVLTSMRHEIRTPLTAILGYVELLRDEVGADKTVESRIAFDAIDCAGQHLLNTINEILDLSKIEEGRMSMVKSEISLPKLLAEIQSTIVPQLSKKNVAWELKLATAIPDRIIADFVRIRQILLKLVGNAAKFTLDGRLSMVVRVRGVGSEALLEIDVEDTGVGMSPRQTEKLFTPFVRADSTDTHEFIGAGLGLSMSRRLARFMGGDVSLEWTEWDRGSRFRFVMPLVAATGALSIENLNISEIDTVPNIPPTPLFLSGRILLAEDGLENQRLISTVLRKAGADVEIASNGVVALAMIEAADQEGCPYQLVLTDIQMPEMNGYTFARTLRSRNVSTPIVALTALALQEEGRRCKEAGCNDYATKPIHRRKLLEVCKSWMDQS